MTVVVVIFLSLGYLFTSDTVDRQVDHRMYRLIWVILVAGMVMVLWCVVHKMSLSP